MKKVFRSLLAMSLAASLTVAGAGLSASAATKAKKVTLTVAAAASLTDVSKTIAAAYKKVAPNVKLQFTYASSGALQTQIEQGASIDVFISAAETQMNNLQNENLLQNDTRYDLLQNRVVLIVPKGSHLGIQGFGDIATKITKTVSIGDPASVPAGKYAQQIFNTLGIWDTVKARANLATDVRQVLSQVETGNVDCGVVYKTDALTSSKVTIVAQAPASWSSKVLYPAAVLKGSKYSSQAKAFLSFLKTSKARAIFTKYGFSKA